MEEKRKSHTVKICDENPSQSPNVCFSSLDSTNGGAGAGVFGKEKNFEAGKQNPIEMTCGNLTDSTIADILGFPRHLS